MIYHVLSPSGERQPAYSQISVVSHEIGIIAGLGAACGLGVL